MRVKTQAKKTHGKKYLIFILVLLILVSLFFINFMKKNSSADYSSKTINTNLSAISTFDYSKSDHSGIKDQKKLRQQKPGELLMSRKD